MAISKSLQCGVVGAGIAGLAAAIALRRAGHEVEIFEKSHFKNEIGAAITLTPNGNRILERWGFDFNKAGATKNNQFRSARGDTLEVVYTDSFAGVEEKYGNRLCAYHRVDLHAHLREIAERPTGGWGPPAHIRLGAEVVKIDCDQGTLTLVKGDTVRKDLIILADGSHCRFLRQVTGEDTPNVKIGKSVYRWLAPMDRIRQDPEMRKLWVDVPQGFFTFHREAGGLFMMTYPCKGGELLNCAIFHDTKEHEKDKDDWNSAATHEDVLEVIEGFHPTLRLLPLKADEVKVYTVSQRAPSSQITRGRVVAIGDAIHHMLPTHAQGGVSAIEDAAALEVILRDADSSLETLKPLLQTYQHLRLPRSATMQILSSTSPRMTMDNLHTQTEMIRKFYHGPLPPWPECSSWSEPIRDFFYAYDIYEQAEKAIKKEELTWFGDCAGSKYELAKGSTYGAQ